MAVNAPDARFRAVIEAKLAAGERLTDADGVGLLAADDLSWLGGLAHRRRTAAAADRTSFVAGDGPVADPVGGRLTVTGERATMRYGAGEEPADLVGALLSLREKAAGGAPVRLFVPVRQSADGGRPAPSGAESMKLFAVCRLLLDTVPELGCDLASHPASTAQLLLCFGASDLLVPADGFDADEVAELIWDAGFTPVHRDADFRTLRDYGPATPQAQRRAEPQSVFS